MWVHTAALRSPVGFQDGFQWGLKTLQCPFNTLTEDFNILVYPSYKNKNPSLKYRFLLLHQMKSPSSKDSLGRKCSHGDLKNNYRGREVCQLSFYVPLQHGHSSLSSWPTDTHWHNRLRCWKLSHWADLTELSDKKKKVLPLKSSAFSFPNEVTK